MRQIAEACERGQCDASELHPFADSYVERERLRLAGDALPKWRREFPDFPAADMPELPAFAIDSSWHNDSCPSFMIAGDAIGAHVMLFVDYADKAKREFPDTERFSIRYLALAADDCLDIYAGDDWAECLRIATAEALAWRFACDVMADLTESEWREMRITNRTVSAGVCASHDFRDANMIMAESFEAIDGRNPVDHLDDESAVALWNAAWSIATPRYLTSDAEGERFDAWRETAGTDNGVLIMYDPGQIDVCGDSFVVTVSNISESFDTLQEAERVLWCLYAKAESK